MTHLHRALQLMQFRKFDAAITELRAYLSEHPNDPEGLASFATCLVNTGEFAKGLQFSEQAVGANPELAIVWSTYAQILSLPAKLNQKYKLALQEAMTNWFRLDDNDPNWYFLSYKQAIDQKKRSEAEAALSEGLRKFPDNVDLLQKGNNGI